MVPMASELFFQISWFDVEHKDRSWRPFPGQLNYLGVRYWQAGKDLCIRSTVCLLRFGSEMLVKKFLAGASLRC
eukprot:s5740_g4.t1